ncbi:MAG: agmatinase [Thermoplasmata archaeon]
MRPAPLVFADARASLQEAEFVIFGVPFEQAPTFRKGSSLAPTKIREASYNFESYIFEQDIDLDDIQFHDAGDVECSDRIDEVLERIRSFSRNIVGSGKIPVAIGGDHSITPAIVGSFDNIGVIILDAHLDFRDSYEDERNSHACVARRVSEIVGIDHVLPVGVRSLSKEELIDAGNLGLSYIPACEIFERKLMASVARKALSFIERKQVYLSVDMDVIDPAYAPAVGNPEPFGLTPSQVREFIDLLGSKLVGLDFVEVSPPHDWGSTSLLAARLIREAIAATKKAHK